MLKIIFSILSSIFAVLCFVPYTRDIFKRKTTPHIYSWLIWTILQGTGALIMFKDGANLGVLSLSIGALLCSFVFILSFKYGTKNIKIFDTICLIGALIAICFWVFLDQPLISVTLISIIDFVGFLPTLRKSYFEPHSETLSTYVLSSLSTLCALIALSHYSLTTTIYLSSLVITNAVCSLILFTRKRK
ncbi:MAG: hypothetical protein NTZ44_01980 [Candidatus Nomurabacteria bacterium]|nr:hypothetical protein [Candidatus Nomurabacteria bacterium]